MGQLQDKVAIVTGASQGIGRAVASKYVAEGARVVVADLLYDEAAELCEELNSEHGQSNEPVALPIKTDVSDKHSVAEMVAGTVEAFGRIDTLVNNGGAVESAGAPGILDHPGGRMGSGLCRQHARALPVQRRGDPGHAKTEQGQDHLYRVRHHLDGAGNADPLRELKSRADRPGALYGARSRPHNICVNMVHPGITDTGGVDREYLEERSKRRFIHRVQEPMDLTGACVFFASDASDFVTGQQLNVDGGIVMA